MTPPSGKTYEGSAVIDDKARTWQAMASKRNDRCVGRPVTINRVDDKTRKGARGTQPAVLTRE